VWSKFEMNCLRYIVNSVASRAGAIWKVVAPLAGPGGADGAAVDAVQCRRELVIENAMLRHQIVILRRKCPHPRLTAFDRLRLLVAAAVLPPWRRALAIVQPETVLRWHREGFRLFWRRRSQPGSVERRVTTETISLIREMAANNRIWGAERIRGELLKLGIKISKRTVQKYMRSVRERRSEGQRWATFVMNHANDIWCCDFVQTYDLLFRPLFLFFLLNQGSRQVVRIAATRNPTQEWTAQQLRNATMENFAPRFLIRDRDEKFGSTFDRRLDYPRTRNE
jgi:putative transposase